MTQVCPVIDKQVNEKVTRMNALLTFIIASVFLFTGFKAIIFFLVFDFLLRGFLDGKYSLIKTSNEALLRAIGAKPALINAGPKIFAARIGLAISIAIGVSYIFGFVVLANTLAGIIGIFAFLEAFFGFCVACKLYPFFYRGSY